MIADFNADLLMGKRFSFGAQGYSPWSDKVVLGDDGNITGYRHPNEATWDITNSNLVFRNTEGEITTQFDMVVIDQGFLSFQGRKMPNGEPKLFLIEFRATITLPAAVAIEQPMVATTGCDLAVLIRTHKCDSKFYDLRKKLELEKSGYDIYPIVDETHGRPPISGNEVIWHSIQDCRDLGLSQDHQLLFVTCGDFPYYFALREIPNYKHYLMIEDDVDLMAGTGRYISEIAALLKARPHLDFVGLLFHELGPTSGWFKACAKAFPQRAQRGAYFPFSIVSKQAAAYLFSQRLLEAIRKTPSQDIVHCEAFVATALTAAGFNCMDLNEMRPFSYAFSSMAMQIGATSVGRPMGYDMTIEIDEPVELVHPIYTVEEYLSRAYRKFILADSNNLEGLSAELASPWTAHIADNLKLELLQRGEAAHKPSPILPKDNI